MSKEKKFALRIKKGKKKFKKKKVFSYVADYD